MTYRDREVGRSDISLMIDSGLAMFVQLARSLDPVGQTNGNTLPQLLVHIT